jgi:prolyl 4-hydroxylase
MASAPPPFAIGRPTVDPMADPAKLGATGREVAQRLRAAPGAVERGGVKADLFVLPTFLDREECDGLVDLIDSRLGPSELFEGTRIGGFRTSSTHYFDNGDPAIDGLQKRICAALGLLQSHAEVMQGQRYLPGQLYRHHFDYFTPGQDYWQQERRRGGQRSWTAMVFLNQPAAGGTTDFARLQLAIEPRIGTLVTWNNMDPAGGPIRSHCTRGCRWKQAPST